MSNLFNLGKRELIRRLKKQDETLSMASAELQKWLQAFVEVAAELKSISPDNEFLKCLPESTMKMIDEKVKENQHA